MKILLNVFSEKQLDGRWKSSIVYERIETHTHVFDELFDTEEQARAKAYGQIKMDAEIFGINYTYGSKFTWEDGAWKDDGKIVEPTP